MSDISFSIGEQKFNYRVAACIRSGDNILLNRLGDSDYWFLPGGRVRAGESAKTALYREIQEELGWNVEVGKFRMCVENFFQHNGTHWHEICLVFDISKFETSILSCEKDLEFKWVPLKELESFDLRPRELFAALASQSAETVHLTLR
jgi:ADP-ribose pyrophosphatase YjhB (NUDIX family)